MRGSQRAFCSSRAVHQHRRPDDRQADGERVEVGAVVAGQLPGDRRTGVVVDAAAAEARPASPGRPSARDGEQLERWARPSSSASSSAAAPMKLTRSSTARGRRWAAKNALASATTASSRHRSDVAALRRDGRCGVAREHVLVQTGGMSATATPDRYTIISADCHAGGSHAAYREYLDPAYVADFDAWRGKYKNPYKDLGDNRRLRNWDNEMRNAQQEEDGIVGEVVFPNTVPPFFPSFVLFAKPPTDDEYEHRHGRRAGPQPLARRLVRRVPRAPGRRRPDLPQRRRRRHRRRALDQGARPARRHPAAEHRPRREVGEAALRPLLRPAVGGAARTSRCRSTCTAAPATPTTARYPVSMLLYINEVLFYTRAPVRADDAVGRVRAVPARSRFVLTEAGCAWVPPLLERLDRIDPRHPRHGGHRRDPLQRRARPAARRHRVLPPERAGWA